MRFSGPTIDFSKRLTRKFAGPVGVFVLLLVGCSSEMPLGTVTGQITKQGKPQAKVTINFTPSDGRRGSQGFTDSDGKYELVYTRERMGAVVGHHHVTVTSPVKTDKNDNIVSGGDTVLSKDVDVSSGSNTFDFDLAVAGEQKSK